METFSNLITSFCFNPYFSGSVTGTGSNSKLYNCVISFNPYFSGSVTGTFLKQILILDNLVSILILVDQSLEPEAMPHADNPIISFNPYFSGSVTGTHLNPYLCQFS